MGDVGGLAFYVICECTNRILSNTLKRSCIVGVVLLISFFFPYFENLVVLVQTPEDELHYFFFSPDKMGMRGVGLNFDFETTKPCYLDT